MLGDSFDKYEIASCSDNERSYSDWYDSDVEADLYGLIHHKENEEFSKETPAKEIFNIIDNPNHENHVSSSNENSFITDVSFLQLFTSFDSPSKRCISPSKLPHIEKSNMCSTRLNNISVDSLISNKLNETQNEGMGIKRKVDSLVVHEEKNWKKISVGSKTIDDLADKKNYVDSSDSDDVIIFEPNTSENFKTNLSEQSIIELSSEDSSDTNFFSSTSNFFEPKMSASFSNIKNVQTISDVWHINNEDLCRSAKKSRLSNRYHDKMSRKCSNCNEMGHLAKSCTLPQQRKCFICGGGHSANSCDGAICSICYKKGHNSRRCWKGSEQRPCASCNMFGHLKKNCPDIWRRYHLTTSNSKIVKGRLLEQNVPLFCFNCGVEGHFGSECPRPRMQSFESSYPTWPLVISYDDHHKITNKDGDYSRKSSEKWPNLNLQSKQKFKPHSRKKPNKNLSTEHQNHKEIDEISKVNGKARKKEFQKNPLRQENDQTPVRQRVSFKSPKNPNINTDNDRLKTFNFPKSRKNPSDSFNSMHQKDKVSEETVNVNPKGRKIKFQKNLLRQENNQMLLREVDFPRSLRKNKSNVQDERLNRTPHSPSSSEIMSVDDIPLALTLAEKKRIKRKERRKRKQLRLLAQMKS